MNVLSEKTALFIAALALALSLGRHLPFANDVFDEGYEAAIVARYQGQIQKIFRMEGFWALKGRPIMNPMPTDPISGVTYVAHPPFVHWIYCLSVSLFGCSEFALRLFPILCCALVGACLAYYAARKRGLWAALAIIVFWTASPMIFFYGRMANFESPVMFWGGIALCCAQKQGKIWNVLLFAAVFAATFSDWAGGFFVPAILVLNWRGQKPILKTAIAATAMVCALGVFFLFIRIWEPGEDVLGLLFPSAAAPYKQLYLFKEDYFPRQFRVWNNYFGILPAIVMLCCVPIFALRLIKGKRDALQSNALAWFVVGLTNVIVFPIRPYDHEFWWFYFLPCFALCVAHVCQGIAKKKILLFFFLIGLCIQAPAYIVSRYKIENTGRSQRVAAFIKENFSDDTLILMARPYGSWEFYVDSWLHYDPYSVTRGETYFNMIVAFQRGKLPFKRLVLWCDVTVHNLRPTILKEAKDIGAEHLRVEGIDVLVLKPW